MIALFVVLRTFGLRALPYDCYSGNGEDYPGLEDTTLSGRKCQNWIEQFPHTHTYLTSDKGIGNHAYCRNPNGAKDKPWCYTLDTSTEWEYCNVKECPAPEDTPTPWTAPAGAKSNDIPCVPAEDTKPPYTKFKIMEHGREYDPGACRSVSVDNVTSYAIGMHKFTATDETSCLTRCTETAGAKYGTYWAIAEDDGANCLCYRECLPTNDPVLGAMNSPATYRMTYSLLQMQRRKKCLQEEAAAKARSEGKAKEQAKIKAENLGIAQKRSAALAKQMKAKGWLH